MWRSRCACFLCALHHHIISRNRNKGAGGCVLGGKDILSLGFYFAEAYSSIGTLISIGWWIWCAWTNTLVLGPGSSQHWVKWFWRLGQVLRVFCTLLLFAYFWKKKKKSTQAKKQEPVDPREIKHFIPTVEPPNSMQTGIENWGDGGVWQHHPKSDWTYFFVMKHGDVCPW